MQIIFVLVYKLNNLVDCKNEYEYHSWYTLGIVWQIIEHISG
jgi:hypothetical protein